MNHELLERADPHVKEQWDQQRWQLKVSERALGLAVEQVRKGGRRPLAKEARFEDWVSHYMQEATAELLAAGVT